MSEFSDARFIMKSKEEMKKGLSESFVVGVIALVFLLTGYQTALFIHRAAVTKIAADRDTPDTVYLYKGMQESSADTYAEGDAARQHTVVRRNSSHSERSEAVRKNVPYRKVESFRFDPNTITVEDLCRLGFYRKQA